MRLASCWWWIHQDSCICRTVTFDRVGDSRRQLAWIGDMVCQKKSSDSLHWTHGCDVDFVCLKLVDSNWATWSSKKDITKDRGSISITKDTKQHVKKCEIAFRGRERLEKCGSSLKAAKQEVWRDGSAPPVVFSSSHSSLMCILAFQNFLTPLGPGQPLGQASLGLLEYRLDRKYLPFFICMYWTTLFYKFAYQINSFENCVRSTSVCKSLDRFTSFSKFL